MDEMYLEFSSKIAVKRRELAPTQQAAFDAFGKRCSPKARYRPRRSRSSPWLSHMSHNVPTAFVGTRKRVGATQQELMEAIWVAAEMRAGGCLCSLDANDCRGRRIFGKINGSEVISCCLCPVKLPHQSGVKRDFPPCLRPRKRI